MGCVHSSLAFCLVLASLAHVTFRFVLVSDHQIKSFISKGMVNSSHKEESLLMMLIGKIPFWYQISTSSPEDNTVWLKFCTQNSSLPWRNAYLPISQNHRESQTMPSWIIESNCRPCPASSPRVAPHAWEHCPNPSGTLSGLVVYICICSF